MTVQLDVGDAFHQGGAGHVDGVVKSVLERDVGDHDARGEDPHHLVGYVLTIDDDLFAPGPMPIAK